MVHPTMWKLPKRQPDRYGWVPKAVSVECQNPRCGVHMPLGDLLSGELNEGSCPVCEMTATMLYGGRE